MIWRLKNSRCKLFCFRGNELKFQQKFGRSLPPRFFFSQSLLVFAKSWAIKVFFSPSLWGIFLFCITHRDENSSKVFMLCVCVPIYIYIYIYADESMLQ